MQNLRFFSTCVALFLAGMLSAQQQLGVITGKILDSKSNDAIIGGTVRLDSGSTGCVSDVDGNFTLRNVEVGIHSLQISYLGYQTKKIDNVEVKVGQETVLSLVLSEESAGRGLKEVVVVADVKKETQTALTLLQKNSSYIADGISAQTIRLTPDRTTGDVIKRISGASIQDNKFAVIRGLADRYNTAMLNGSPLSSTEPDRRAFSLDVFPSAMLDNLVVVKTESADLPGEWAGGAILITTRDIPSKNFMNVSVSSGYNTAATFQPGVRVEGGKTDWLGFSGNTRSLPSAMPARTDYVNLPLEDRITISKQFKNNWAIEQTESVNPNIGVQLSGGWITKLKGASEWGTTIATTYNNTNSVTQGERNDFDDNGQIFAFAQNANQNSVSLGALVNSALKLNPNHKIGLQTLHSTNTTQSIIMREGANFEIEQYIKSNSVEFIENHLLTTRIYGEHLIFGGIKANWSGGYNRIDRTTPNTRRAAAAKNFDDAESAPFLIDLPPGSATRDRGAMFYSDLNENVLNGQVDFSVPFKLYAQKHLVKFGTLYQSKDRGFAARNLGYIKAKSSQFDQAIFANSDFSTIFNPDHIGSSGLVIDEITNLFDAYQGKSTQNAAYALVEQVLTSHFRLSYGARLERFNQKLNSFDQTAQPVNVDQTYTDLLPSLNAKYELNAKTNLRLSLSKTTSRPEFREIAPFPFYDYEELATVIGNPKLVRTQIYNADLRCELFPGGNQIISASAFYKHFNNPIEYTLSSLGAGTSNRSYQNVPSAQSIGIELEGRKNLAFLFGDAGYNWSTFANLALIKSKIDVSTLNTSDPKRPLQGQSPYVINTGVGYANPELGLNSMLILNVVGDRLSRVGTSNYADIYEKNRPVLDFSLVKDLGKSQLKLTISDILRRDQVFYQDNNQNHKYDSTADNVFIRGNRGTTISLSASVKL